MTSEVYQRAAGYPYALLEQSFVMEAGRHRPLGDSVDFSGRRPILAVGSNMSPEQLARKFPDADHGVIPVTRIRLRDFDSVYSAHITGYGSIAATLHPSPGTEVTLFITWLDPRQEERMHATETTGENYRYCRLNALDLKHDAGTASDEGPLDSLYAYISARGALTARGEPVPLAEIPAHGRRWNALGQLAVQDHARRLLAPGVTLTDFIHQNVEDAGARSARTDALCRTALPFDWPALEAFDV